MIYLAKLPGLSRKLRVMVDWTLEIFFARVVSLLLSPPGSPRRRRTCCSSAALR